MTLLSKLALCAAMKLMPMKSDLSSGHSSLNVGSLFTSLQVMPWISVNMKCGEGGLISRELRDTISMDSTRMIATEQALSRELLAVSKSSATNDLELEMIGN